MRRIPPKFRVGRIAFTFFYSLSLPWLVLTRDRKTSHRQWAILRRMSASPLSVLEPLIALVVSPVLCILVVIHGLTAKRYLSTREFYLAAIVCCVLGAIPGMWLLLRIPERRRGSPIKTHAEGLRLSGDVSNIFPPRPGRKKRWKLQFVPAAFLGIVVTFWLRGCTSGSIGNWSTTVYAYNGVRLWMTGHNPVNAAFEVTSYKERWGFINIRGIEAGHAVNVVIAPHWLFLALAVPFAFWLGLLLKRDLRTRGRAAAGLCPSCGYSLTGNTTGVCPECGMRIQQAPFAYSAPELQATEGFTTDEEGIDRFVLNLSLVVTANRPISAQIRFINEAVLKCLRLRGDRCQRIAFVIVAEPADEQEVVSWLVRLLNQRIPEGNLLRRLDVEVEIRSPAGKKINKLQLGGGAQQRLNLST